VARMHQRKAPTWCSSRPPPCRRASLALSPPASSTAFSPLYHKPCQGCGRKDHGVCASLRDLFLPKRHQPGASLHHAALGGESFTTLSVPLVSLDDYFAENDSKPPFCAWAADDLEADAPPQLLCRLLIGGLIGHCQAKGGQHQRPPFVHGPVRLNCSR